MTVAGQVDERVSTEVPPVDAGTTASQNQDVDLDRALTDEAYLKEVNEQLTKEEVPSPDEKATDPPAPDTAATAQPQEDEYVTFEDGDPIYRGAPFKVKKSELRALVQKGRNHDVRLEELSPYIRLGNEAPDVVEKLRTPEGRREVVERIRQKNVPAADKDDVLKVEGYDDDDVKAVDQIVSQRLEAHLKKMGISSQSQTAALKEAGLSPAEAERRLERSNMILEGLRIGDGMYPQVLEKMQHILNKFQLEADPEDFKRFAAAVNDPFAKNEATGRPIFVHFYEDCRAALMKETAAAPEIPASRESRPGTARMAPGAAATPTTATTVRDLTKLPQAEFDRAFNEALARG